MWRLFFSSCIKNIILIIGIKTQMQATSEKEKENFVFLGDKKAFEVQIVFK